MTDKQAPEVLAKVIELCVKHGMHIEKAEVRFSCYNYVSGKQTFFSNIDFGLGGDMSGKHFYNNVLPDFEASGLSVSENEVNVYTNSIVVNMKVS